MKYIIVQAIKAGKPTGPPRAIIFDDGLIHSEVARFRATNKMAVIAAGYCSASPIDAWGHSESLGIESRPEDLEIIRSLLSETEEFGCPPSVR